jgi:hypothetical protein
VCPQRNLEKAKKLIESKTLDKSKIKELVKLNESKFSLKYFAKDNFYNDIFTEEIFDVSSAGINVYKNFKYFLSLGPAITK